MKNLTENTTTNDKKKIVPKLRNSDYSIIYSYNSIANPYRSGYRAIYGRKTEL